MILSVGSFLNLDQNSWNMGRPRRWNISGAIWRTASLAHCHTSGQVYQQGIATEPALTCAFSERTFSKRIRSA